MSAPDVSVLGTHHQDQVGNFLKYAKKQRDLQLQEIDSAFTTIKDTRLLQDDYTDSDVVSILDGLAQTLKATVQSEFIKMTNSTGVMLVHLLGQAEKRSAWLDVDPLQLESGQQQSAVSALEQQLTKPVESKRLPSLQQTGREELDAIQLRDENKGLRDRCHQLQTQFTAASREKTELREQLEQLRSELSALRSETATLKTEASRKADSQTDVKAAALQSEASLRTELSDAKASAQKAEAALRAELSETKAKLAQLQAELEAARKEVGSRLSESKQFQSLQKMLTTKNQQVKELREALAKYQPPEDLPADA
eukprot:TRINITY_DN13437_c0_g1_i1.p1 TRINITY_DN13437_c0_g1~~TRINITY_DN13437_c0_g1_i1.p1  ORF type:complete len:311 (+),score=83.27 TRINITY_DN13437_c0_g1_i1:68-1000(+)